MGKARSEKLCLTTSSKDYDGHLGLPAKIKQREYETTGQFFRRLDRLVAKAKVEADLEARFDVSLHKDKKAGRVKAPQKANPSDDPSEPKRPTPIKRKRNHPNRKIRSDERSSSRGKRLKSCRKPSNKRKRR